MVGLHRQGGISGTTPSHKQQLETKRYSIPVYSGDIRYSIPVARLSECLQRCKDSLTLDQPIQTTTRKSRIELTQAFGERIVDQSLRVWLALTEAVEGDEMISRMVIRAKSPSKAWQGLNSMIVYEESKNAEFNDRGKIDTKAILSGESGHKYVLRTIDLVNELRCHKVEVTDDEICSRFLTSLPLSFAMMSKVCFNELEGALVKVEELKKQPDEMAGHTLYASFNGRGAQGGRGGGRGRQNNGGDRDGGNLGKHDGRRCQKLQYYSQQQQQPPQNPVEWGKPPSVCCRCSQPGFIAAQCYVLSPEPYSNNEQRGNGSPFIRDVPLPSSPAQLAPALLGLHEPSDAWSTSAGDRATMSPQSTVHSPQ